MAQLLRMPEISANMVEAVLSEWPLAENATFSAGDAIATVETDKAVVDVPAEFDGVLLRTLVEPGKSVTVGSPMAVLAAVGEDVGDLDALVQRLTGADAEDGDVTGVAEPEGNAGVEVVSVGAVPAAEVGAPAVADVGAPAAVDGAPGIADIAAPPVGDVVAPRINDGRAPLGGDVVAPGVGDVRAPGVSDRAALAEGGTPMPADGAPLQRAGSGPDAAARSASTGLTGSSAEASAAGPTPSAASAAAPTTTTMQPAAPISAAVRADAAGAESGRVFASPLARRIAKENGLHVGDIQGTGPGGRIVRDDVHQALAARSASPPPQPEYSTSDQRGSDGAPSLSGSVAGAPDGAAPARAVGDAGRAPAGSGAASAPGQATVAAAAQPGGARAGSAGSARYTDVPHTRMRRAIATRLAESNREAPVFTIRGSARVDALLALRRELNEAIDVRISVNDLIVAAAARAHMAVPEMNVIWMPDAVRRFDDVDIAVAVATDTGLVTPVIRGVQAMTVSALARAGADAVGRARAGRLRQDELEGGTLTVTNLGVFGTEDFTAVINPPQAAILAVGAARQEAVVTEGELGVATVLRVTLSVDHRPVDGATAARWMAAFLALLESPLRILV